MNYVPSMHLRLRALLPMIALAWSFSIAVLGIAVVTRYATDIPIGRLTDDPTTIAQEPFYTGVISNVGVLLWTAAASACLLSAAALRRRPGAETTRRFLLSSGLFTLLLTVDDLFLLHEEVFPQRLHVGQKVVLGSYALLTMAYVAAFRRVILGSDAPLLALAVAFLGASGVVDQLPLTYNGDVLLEDGLKFFGITTWLVYFFRTSLTALLEEGAVPRTARTAIRRGRRAAIDRGEAR